MFQFQSSSWETDCEEFEGSDTGSGSYIEESSFGFGSPDSAGLQQDDFSFSRPVSFPLGSLNGPAAFDAVPESMFYFSPPNIKDEFNTVLNTSFYLNNNGTLKDDCLPPQPVQMCGGLDLVIDGQPAAEVRTRTPSELRTFSVSARVMGPLRHFGAANCRVALLYAHGDLNSPEPVMKEILGGTKLVPILADGTVVYDSLSISESSTKHKEREFLLEFTVLRVDGETLIRRNSRPFYAYSHKKVLQRRGSVKLRALSRSSGGINGGESMHVIGTPFIQGPALSLIFRSQFGEIVVKPSEYFSDSVLFFELPALPIPPQMLPTLPYEAEFKVQVLVTNDGRTHSNPVDFTYYVDAKEGTRSRCRY